MNDVDDGTWPRGLEVLEESSCMSSVSIRRVYAFCREVVELLEVRIHDDLLLICILERLGPLDGVFSLSTY